MRETGIPLTEALVKIQADKLAQSPLSDVPPHWTASNGFLSRFKKRHGIRRKTLAGELRSANEHDAASERLRIKTLICEKSPEEAFDTFINQDETALFWKCLPTKSLSSQSKETGAKRSKDRITIAIFSSSDGSIFEPYVIGKARNPHCFRTQEDIPFKDRYMSSKKAWMTIDLCRKMLNHFQDRLALSRPTSNYLIFWDNASSHPPELSTKPEHLFFSPNLTSMVQPNDQGIILAFKMAYRREFLTRLLLEVEAEVLLRRNLGEEIPPDLATRISKQYTLRDALECIQVATSYMRQNTRIAANCWAKADILPNVCFFTSEFFLL